MEEELRPTDFVDYQAVFSETLTLVGRGMSVSEALETHVRDRFPLTHKEITAEARLILARLKEEREWGSLRALRELATQAGLCDELRRGEAEHKSAPALSRPPQAIADFPRLFALAQRKRQSGFSLDDSLEMAARELYPQTFRKVRDSALFYVRLAARKRNVHELRALRDLAEEPTLFREIEHLAPE